VTAYSEVFEIFGDWFDEAKKKEPKLPDAMSLSTVNSEGEPSSRMVLLKDWSQDGFVFYTNFESRKGKELLANPVAALLFYWKSTSKQIRIEGPVARVSDEEADEYFSTRPKEAQIGAWASDQSRPMEGGFALEKAVAKFALQYAVGTVPRPPHWSGFRVKPQRVEFWHERKFRLHDRRLFQLNEDGQTWNMEKLYP
jgi:pyridoxamine 5'-phosphate oxidase